jgi:hypothetical protein
MYLAQAVGQQGITEQSTSFSTTVAILARFCFILRMPNSHNEPLDSFVCHNAMMAGVIIM